MFRKKLNDTFFIHFFGFGCILYKRRYGSDVIIYYSKLNVPNYEVPSTATYLLSKWSFTVIGKFFIASHPEVTEGNLTHSIVSSTFPIIKEG